MLRTLTVNTSGAYQLTHDDLVQASGDDPSNLPDPFLVSIIAAKVQDLRRLGHFEVHYEQRDTTQFTHLRASEEPVIEVSPTIEYDGFFVLHNNIGVLVPPAIDYDVATEENAPQPMEGSA